MRYQIHYYEKGKLVNRRGNWDYQAAMKFLKRLGYKLNSKYNFVKKHRRAEIVGFNGIPF